MAKSNLVYLRRKSIVSTLFEHAAMSVEEIHAKLREDDGMQEYWAAHDARRAKNGRAPDKKTEMLMIRRDLKEMEGKEVERDQRLKEQGGRTPARSGAPPSNADYWKFMSRESEKTEELDKYVAFIALRTLSEVLDWSLPETLVTDLQAITRRAKERLKHSMASNPNDPTTRWLSSLRLRAAYSYFETQQIDPDVRDIVALAITEKKKAAMRLNAGDLGPFPPGLFKVSISHYILTLPDSPWIMVWPHECAGYDDPRSDSESFLIPLAQILEITILPDEEAEWPGDFSPKTFKRPEVSAVPDDAWKSLEFRMSPYLDEKLIGTWLHKKLHEGGGIIGIDDEGWLVCRISYPPPGPSETEWEDERSDLFSFLRKHLEDVEILAPYFMRMKSRAELKEAFMRYEDCQPMSSDVREKYLEELHPMQQWFILRGEED